MERRGGEMQQEKRERDSEGLLSLCLSPSFFLSSAAISNALCNSGSPIVHDNIFP